MIDDRTPEEIAEDEADERYQQDLWDRARHILMRDAYPGFKLSHRHTVTSWPIPDPFDDEYVLVEINGVPERSMATEMLLYWL